MNDSTEPRRSLVRRIAVVLKQEVGQIDPRAQTLSFVSRLLPLPANTLRAAILRRMGVAVGEGTRVLGTPTITAGGKPLSNLSIGRECTIGAGCTFDLNEQVTIADRVTIGHQTLILTSSHELGPREHRAGTLYQRPVAIQSGAWLGPRCIVLPGVTIGRGAVVAAGSLVNKDVDEHTRVAGVPAKPSETLAP